MNREILAERPLNLPINPSPEDLIAQNDIYNTKSNQLDENTIEEYIEILLQHQKTCEKAARYVEAEMARKRIQDLREKDDKTRVLHVKSRHQGERSQLEEAHLNEFTQFNEFWDKKMEEFAEQAKLIEGQMIEKHQNEIAGFLEELDRVLPMKPKDSGELLNMRKIQEALARQQNYVEAHKVQQRALQIEKGEFEKWAHFREQKLRNQRNQFEGKQANELFALQKRIVSGQEEQRKARALELERLLQKYQNAKKELEVQQLGEIAKINKNHSLGSVYKGNGMRNSRLSSANSRANGSVRKGI